jgi:hypothetical protein
MPTDVRVIGHVGPGVSADGLEVPMRLGKENQQVYTRLHGEVYEATSRASVFACTTTILGLAIPIYTTTAPLGNVLWNPMGSGKNLVPISYTANCVSGTAVYASIMLMGKKTNQSNLATGAYMTAFAETTPINCLFGSGTPNTIKCSNAGTVTITAGTAAEGIQTMFNINGEGAAAGLHTTSMSTFEFNGKWIFPPGSLIWVAATLASVALFAQTWVWEEVAV